MSDYVELEIGLYSKDLGATPAEPPANGQKDYLVELRLHDPDDPFRRKGARGTATFDLTSLYAAEIDPPAYGHGLCQGLLASPDLQTYFEIARSQTESAAPPKTLRISLAIDTQVPELHGLRWETLRDYRAGETDKWLLTKHQILFSRFLNSPGWDRIQLRPKTDLRALSVVANPTDLPAALQVTTADELQRARAALSPLIPEELYSDPTHVGQVTLTKLVERLRAGCDILYLACHGTLANAATDPQARLLLEKEDGSRDSVLAKDLVDRIADLPPNLRPRLVVLASCESAGTGATADRHGALAAVGPQLAQAGIPAVLAMQGSVSVATAQTYIGKFFSELLDHGQVDLAAAVARGAVAGQPDCWMPVLYLRLTDGHLWYKPRLVGGKKDSELWDTLKTYYESRECTPIIGPGLSETVLGSRKHLAAAWAEKHGYPLDDHDREELEQVAQFLATAKAGNIPGKTYQAALKDYVCRRYEKYLPADPAARPLGELLAVTSRIVGQLDPREVHNLLACLDFPLYITANPDTLLVEALRHRGKQPVEFVCHWRQADARQDDLSKLDPPDPDHPWVYYLFGRIDDDKSLVLTLDHFFEYLVVVHRSNRIPNEIWEALTNRALLFLGFELSDWPFRTLFRSILNQENSRLMEDFAHVAVQIDPQGARIREPAQAREYLEKYFTKASKDFSVYWGRAEDFVLQFLQHVKPGGC